MSSTNINSNKKDDQSLIGLIKRHKIETSFITLDLHLYDLLKKMEVSILFLSELFVMTNKRMKKHYETNMNFI